MEARWKYKAISAYKKPEHRYGVEDSWAGWLPCPDCGLKPLVWEFDNGRSTACGCGVNEYNHHSIAAESVMSIIKRSHNGTSVEEYDLNELRDNWNTWVITGVDLFPKAQRTANGKW